MMISKPKLMGSSFSEDELIGADISQSPSDRTVDDGLFASVDGFSVIRIPWEDIRWFTDNGGVKRFMIVGQSAETLKKMSRDGYSVCIPPIPDERLELIQCANGQVF